ncbi:unnamed protein product, partial [Choristocarpus tenellus]
MLGRAFSILWAIPLPDQILVRFRGHCYSFPGSRNFVDGDNCLCPSRGQYQATHVSPSRISHFDVEISRVGLRCSCSRDAFAVHDKQLWNNWGLVLDCSHRNRSFDAGTLWRYGAFYFLSDSVSTLYALIIYIKLYMRIARVLQRFSAEIDVGRGSKQELSISLSQEQQDRMRKFGKRLFWYLAVMIFCWTFPTINRIQNTVDPNNPIFTLLLLTGGLQGFLNAIVYGLTDKVQEALMEIDCMRKCMQRHG